MTGYRGSPATAAWASNQFSPHWEHGNPVERFVERGQESDDMKIGFLTKDMQRPFAFFAGTPREKDGLSGTCRRCFLSLSTGSCYTESTYGSPGTLHLKKRGTRHVDQQEHVFGAMEPYIQHRWGAPRSNLHRFGPDRTPRAQQDYEG